MFSFPTHKRKLKRSNFTVIVFHFCESFQFLMTVFQPLEVWHGIMVHEYFSPWNFLGWLNRFSKLSQSTKNTLFWLTFLPRAKFWKSGPKNISTLKYSIYWCQRIPSAKNEYIKIVQRGILLVSPPKSATALNKTIVRILCYFKILCA